MHHVSEKLPRVSRLDLEQIVFIENVYFRRVYCVTFGVLSKINKVIFFSCLIVSIILHAFKEIAGVCARKKTSRQTAWLIN